MAIKISTGLAKYLHSTGSMKKCFTGGKLEIRSGAAPATADAAATGTLLYTIVNAAAVAKVKQKIRFTPTPGTANGGVWNIILNGHTFSFTDDGTPSVAEICTGLYNLIRAGIRTTAITTPAGAITIPDVDGLFVLTDNATSLDIEAATAGIPFDYSATVTGAGAGTGSWATAIQTADAYGLQFEDASAITLGELEKLSTQTWSGIAVADGTPGYFRLVTDADAGGLSTTLPRFQGTVSTVAGSDMVITHATVTTGETINVDSAKFRIPIT